ncbi:hypothetical protein LV716_07720 [Flagellimonas sp. HMM57]|uniref:hypothetical protein n=1 Tax=unclassified Flagellimonas TaxID=2644544 RepID=UPI0013D67188|nr:MULTISPECIES: hypothetical protein [unclassified Flagellimonas]UII77645.1 hypothetical protein LV716_07720 [Flagellimonas sp. HMM57]
MKKITSLILLTFLFQSCHTYKTVAISEIEKGRTYELTLKNGQSFESKCQEVNEQSIALVINKKVMELPTSRIEMAKRKKLSAFKLASGLSLAAIGSVLLIKNGDKDTFLEQLTE